MMKQLTKRAGILLCCVLLLLTAACGKTYLCEECGESFSGKAYYGMGGDEILCEDCARSYWLPFDYREFEWSKPPKQSDARAIAAFAQDSPEDWADEPPADDPITPIESAEERADSALQSFIGQINEQLAVYDAASDAEGAITYLKQQLDLMDVTYDYVDETLSDRLDAYRADYKQQALANAKTAFESEGYEAAIKLLNKALGLIGDDDADIQKAIDYYNGFGPAWLDELSYFAREAGLFNSVYWNNTYSSLETDSEGAVHTHAMYTQTCPDRTATQTYLIDGKYRTFSGIVYLPQESREMEQESHFRVYGDGQLLYTSPGMMEGVRAVPFSIDVTGVTTLMIAADSVDYSYQNTLCAGELLLEP